MTRSGKAGWLNQIRNDDDPSCRRRKDACELWRPTGIDDVSKTERDRRRSIELGKKSHDPAAWQSRDKADRWLENLGGHLQIPPP
jgi:hypothetical protein